ncbi:hypothetical protein MetMK1DRAFT_00005520 [Metallosphaera yellowstonensis MK1]|uniref:Uncharacterized protein n=1 Tax=Metallosphaera yellowstonensis MK1 TaxID=671065 RepID=H2C1C9_9CREN|nr:hypothetical protein MetMK1DRAFT_00005520 [Metallosphaera yellowstonensis MK1]
MAEDLEHLDEIVNVVEPETRLPVVKLGLVNLSRGDMPMLHYTPPSPFTPPILVIYVAIQLNKGGKVSVERYYLSEEINRRLEEGVRLPGEAEVPPLNIEEGHYASLAKTFLTLAKSSDDVVMRLSFALGSVEHLALHLAGELEPGPELYPRAIRKMMETELYSVFSAILDDMFELFLYGKTPRLPKVLSSLSKVFGE